MRKLSDTIARLASMKAAGAAGQQAATPARLAELEAFGSDPGNLRALVHVPDRLADRPALVVVLHGCTQTAAAYDAGSGWSRLADEHGFVVLFPEQRRANNSNLCFSWFSPADTRRDAGEVSSIRQMVATLAERHGIDPARIFVTGLSAGGAMAAAMLATYPDVFAGGAIIAGLPYGSASSIPEAFDRMRGHGGPRLAELGRLVRDASDHAGPWPTVSIWHGTRDATVDAANAAALVEQWRAVHGVAATPSLTETVDGQSRRVWRDAAGRAVIEEYSIAGMGHGTPLHALGTGGREVAGPFMLEVGISSTGHIAAFWGLTEEIASVGVGEVAKPVAEAAEAVRHDEAVLPAIRAAMRVVEPPSAKGGVQPQGVAKVIEDALRAAGLMR